MAESENVEKGKRKGTKATRDIFAFFLWLYAIVKLFVFDLDVYLIQTYLPTLWWLVKFKFIFLIVLISIYWLTVGDKKFYKTVLFLAFFPFYLFLWRVGRLAFRNWFITFALFGYIGSFLKSLKFNFISFTVFCVASLLVVTTNDPYLITFGIILLALYLILHFGRRIYYAFAPSKAMIFPREGVVKVLTTAKTQLALPPEIKSTSIEKFTESQRTKWQTNLQCLLLANRVTTFTASKLREFRESRLIFVYFIFGLLFTFFITVISFAFVNYGIQRLDPVAFSDATPKNIFFFLYYSFKAILSRGVSDFYPLSGYARLADILEGFLGYLIAGILFFMYLNIKSEKAKTEMDSVIHAMNQQGIELESFINIEFSMDIEHAISEVMKLPNNLLNIFSHFSSKWARRERGA